MRGGCGRDPRLGGPPSILGQWKERVRFKAELVRVGLGEGVWLSLTSFGAQGWHRWDTLPSGLWLILIHGSGISGWTKVLY